MYSIPVIAHDKDI